MQMQQKMYRLNREHLRIVAEYHRYLSQWTATRAHAETLGCVRAATIPLTHLHLLQHLYMQLTGVTQRMMQESRGNFFGNEAHLLYGAVVASNLTTPIDIHRTAYAQPAPFWCEYYRHWPGEPFPRNDNTRTQR